MAKVKPGIVNVSGKVGDGKIVVQGKHGAYLRSVSSKPTSKRQLEVLEGNFKYNKPMNAVVSDVKSMIETPAPFLYSGEFYKQLQKAAKKCKTANRYILLKAISKVNIAPTYPLSALSPYNSSVQQEDKKIVINLEVRHHPTVYRYQSYESNCHFFQYCLMSWKGEEKGIMQLKATRWISDNEDKKFFIVYFDLPDAEHWLLTIHHIVGENNKPLETVRAEGIAFMEAGTYVETDVEAYAKFVAEKRKQESIVGHPHLREMDVERVGAVGE